MSEGLSNYEVGGIVLVVIVGYKLLEKGLALIRDLIKLLVQRRNGGKAVVTPEVGTGLDCKKMLDEKVNKELCDERHKNIKDQLAALFANANETKDLVNEVKTDVAVIAKGVARHG